MIYRTFYVYFSYQDIIREIEVEEGLIEQAKSLQHKLGENCDAKEITSFVIQLIRGKEVSVPNGSRGSIGSQIIQLFCDAQKVKIIIFVHFFSFLNDEPFIEFCALYIFRFTNQFFILIILNSFIDLNFNRL